MQILCSRITPTISYLDLSTHFLDTTILSSIGHYGALGSLTHLTLATTGTRLTAEGLKQALERCSLLEKFVLKDGEGERRSLSLSLSLARSKLTVPGRLDKNTWAQIDAWPKTLRSFTIEIDESAGHHSWVLDHLASIDHIPFAQLQEFRVGRLVHPIARLPFPPVGVAIPSIQKGYELSPVPMCLLQAIVEGEPNSDLYNFKPNAKMRILCLDWWEIGPNELDGLVKSLPSLRFLQVAISFPLVKMASPEEPVQSVYGDKKLTRVQITMMQTTFAGSADMSAMRITSAPKYNLEVAPTKSKPDYTVPNMPAYLVSKLRDPDPSIPDTKDVRKFARRMPKLKSLQWVGRVGKASGRSRKRRHWLVSRSRTRQSSPSGTGRYVSSIHLFSNMKNRNRRSRPCFRYHLLRPYFRARLPSFRLSRALAPVVPVQVDIGHQTILAPRTIPDRPHLLIPNLGGLKALPKGRTRRFHHWHLSSKPLDEEGLPMAVPLLSPVPRFRVQEVVSATPSLAWAGPDKCQSTTWRKLQND